MSDHPPINDVDFLSWLEDREKRQDHILKHVPKCPSCGSEQVQIMRFVAPAQWRCRICKVAFEFEPEQEDQSGRDQERSTD